MLEIGSGTGANFRFVSRGSQLLALEPNEAMHQRLFTNAQRSGVELQLLKASAEAIPLPDDSVDTVIATLVHCTVQNPQRVLAEVRRVLRPGGTFRFVEHVAAHTASPRRWLQHIVAKPWAWLFEGCSTHRNTAQVLEAAGFNKLIFESRCLRLSVFIPVNSAIWGIATE